jgi:hypothetical protein
MMKNITIIIIIINGYFLLSTVTSTFRAAQVHGQHQHHPDDHHVLADDIIHM